MRKTRKSAKGFTLIELMIVVAIIGILAAIAIPNFLRFQAKARQSEAKTNLGGIFTAHTAYFSEYGAYSGTMSGTNGINWSPSGAHRYTYSISAGDPATAVVVNTIGTPIPAPGCGSAVTDLAFTACAEGVIATGTAPTPDEWTMNDVRNLRNTVVGF
jgi:type IV pilus assembly protein PilA